MSFVEWTEDLSVGVKEIDDQHKKLFGMINDFNEIDLEKDRDGSAMILSEFIGFVGMHFSTEEDFFELCAYRGAKEHIEEHVGYAKRVLQFQRDYEGGTYDSAAFLEFLKEWWEDHLKTVDKKYVGNFHTCGLR